MKLTIIIYVYVYIASKYVPWSTIVYFLVNVRPPPLIRDYCSNFRRNPDMRWMTIPHNPSRTMSFSDGTGWDTEEGPEFRWMKHFTNTHDTILIVSCCFLIN